MGLGGQLFIIFNKNSCFHLGREAVIILQRAKLCVYTLGERNSKCVDFELQELLFSRRYYTVLFYVCVYTWDG